MKFTWSCRWMKKKKPTTKKRTLPLNTAFESQRSREREDPRTGWEKTRDEGAFVSRRYYRLDSSSPPEAEPSPDLSRDRGVITTRWINTRAVKVKWCYVARCYWTRPVERHDTIPFPAFPGPCCGLSPCPDTQERVKCWNQLCFHCLWHNREDHLIPGGSFQMSWSM